MIKVLDQHTIDKIAAGEVLRILMTMFILDAELRSLAMFMWEGMPE